MTKASDNVFPRFLISEGGSTTTPAAGNVTVYAKADGLLYSKDDAGVETALGGGGSGDVATDAIWDAAGDIVQGTGANTAARLALGAAGTVVRSTGATNAYAFPPGYEFDYVAFTSPVSVTGTTTGTADTIVTGGAVTYDGSTIIILQFFAPHGRPDAGAGRSLNLYLFDGSTEVGRLGSIVNSNATTGGTQGGLNFEYRFTPSAAAHTYSVRATVTAGTGSISAGVGGAGAINPGFIRQRKV